MASGVKEEESPQNRAFRFLTDSCMSVRNDCAYGEAMFLAEKHFIEGNFDKMHEILLSLSFKEEEFQGYK